MSDRRSSAIRRGVVVGAGGLVVVAIGVIAFRGRLGDVNGTSGSSSADSPTGSLDPMFAGAAAASQVAPDSSQPRAQILAKTSVAEAIAFARPLMTNTAGRLDSGSALLSLWAADRLTWDDLDRLAETSAALFRRDPEAERGKRLCMSGTIIEIRAEKDLAGRLAEDRALPLIERPAATAHAPTVTDPVPGAADSWEPIMAAPTGMPGIVSADWTIPHDGKVFVATLREKTETPPEGAAGREARRTTDKNPLMVEIIAVKSSGTLVDGSDARVCGILTGVTLPAQASSGSIGDATEHRIVGMFDLPENRAAAAVAHHGA